MSESSWLASAPEIPDAGQPFVLRRTRMGLAFFTGPAAIVGCAVAFSVAAAAGAVDWEFPLCFLVPLAVLFTPLAMLNYARFAGPWLAADPDTVWVRRGGRRSLAIRVPWEMVDSIFAIRSERGPLIGREYLIVVRVRGLPANLREPLPDRHRGPGGRAEPGAMEQPVEPEMTTFRASTYLSNVTAAGALAELAHLAAGRCRVG